MSRKDTSKFSNTAVQIVLAAALGIAIYFLCILLLSALIYNEAVSYESGKAYFSKISILPACMLCCILAGGKGRGGRSARNMSAASVMIFAIILIGLCLGDELNIASVILSVSICYSAAIFMSIIKSKNSKVHKRSRLIKRNITNCNQNIGLT